MLLHHASNAAKEKCKHAREINKSKETTDLHNISGSRSQTSAQAKDRLKKRKFCKNSYQRDKCCPMEKYVITEKRI